MTTSRALPTTTTPAPVNTGGVGSAAALVSTAVRTACSSREASCWSVVTSPADQVGKVPWNTLPAPACTRKRRAVGPPSPSSTVWVSASGLPVVPLAAGTTAVGAGTTARNSLESAASTLTTSRELVASSVTFRNFSCVSGAAPLAGEA